MRELQKTVMNLVLVALFAALFAAPALAGAEAASALFSEGSARVSLFGGSASAFNRNYALFGIGAGYFIADGLEAGLDAEFWSGSSPAIEQVSPQVRYVMRPNGSLCPYLGVFFRETIIQGYRNQETVGGRAGAYFLQGKHFYIGAGLAQEIHVSCDRTVYAACAELYPEILAAFVF